MQMASGKVGEFSKFQRIKVTPTNERYLEVSHNLGVIPKLVIVTSEQTYVSVQYVFNLILCTELINGFAEMFGNSGNITYGAYEILTNQTGETNARAYFNVDSVHIRRFTSARYFDLNTEYTIDIYA